MQACESRRLVLDSYLWAALAGARAALSIVYSSSPLEATDRMHGTVSDNLGHNKSSQSVSDPRS